MFGLETRNSWAASREAWPAGWGRGFCPSAPLWWDPAWSPPSSSGALSTRRTWSFWSGSKGGHRNDQSAGEPLLWGQVERVGAVQPGEGKAPWRPYSSLPVLKGAYNKDGENLFSGACCNRTRGNGFNLKEGRFRLDKIFTVRVMKPWNVFSREVVDAPCLQGHIGQGSEQPHVVKDVPLQGDWARWPLKVPSNPNHSMIKSTLWRVLQAVVWAIVPGVQEKWG